MKKNQNKTLITILIAIVIYFLIRLLLPASNGLTEKGVGFVAVLVSTVFIWIVDGTSIASCLYAACMLAIFNTVPITTTLSTAFGHTITLMTLGVSMLLVVLQKSGVTMYIARWMLSRKFVQGHYYRFMIVLLLTNFIICALTNGLLAILALLVILEDIMDIIGEKKNGKIWNTTFMFMMLTATYCDNSLPFGKVMPLLGVTYANQFGYPASGATYLGLSLPYVVIVSVVLCLYVRFILRPDTTAFKNYTVERIKADLEKEPLTKEGKFAFAMTIVVFLLLLLPITNIPVISTYLAGYASVVPFFLVLLVMALVPIDGKPIIKLSEVARDTNWTIVLFSGMLSALSSIVGGEDIGLVAALGKLLSPLTEGISPIALLILVGLITFVLTNLMSNMVTLALMVTVFAPVFIAQFEGGALPVNPAIAIVYLTISAGIAVVTPAANVGPAMVMERHLDMKKIFVPNLVGSLLMFCSLTVALLIHTYVF